MSAMDVKRPHLAELWTTVGGTVDPGRRSPGQVHVTRVVGVAYLHEHELIDIVVGEAMEVATWVGALPRGAVPLTCADGPQSSRSSAGVRRRCHAVRHSPPDRTMRGKGMVWSGLAQ
jgi:hypothetical protein